MGLIRQNKLAVFAIILNFAVCAWNIVSAHTQFLDGRYFQASLSVVLFMMNGGCLVFTAFNVGRFYRLHSSTASVMQIHNRLMWRQGKPEMIFNDPDKFTDWLEKNAFKF